MSFTYKNPQTDIDSQGRKALQEYITSRTVLINSETPGFQHGTGVAVSYQNEDYILTAAHVLENEPRNENLLITGRPDSAVEEVKKSALRETFFSKLLGKKKSSTGTHLTITQRLVSKGHVDIAALKVRNARRDLPNTTFHNLSDQGPTAAAEGMAIIICGFPGEIAVHHKVTGQHRIAAFLYFAVRNIVATSKSPERLDPSTDFVTDFSLEEDECDPKGISGGGAWTIPETRDGELWSPQAQLLGIQSGVYRDNKLMRLVRIESALSLLSGS